MSYQYDYLIVGAGLYGSVFAHEARNKGKRVLVIDKRYHTGGNIYCEHIAGINVHKYGPHIFHTDNRRVWQYVNRFVEFNNFVYSPLASYEGKLYNLPFNMNTFYQLWGVKTPLEAQRRLDTERAAYAHILNPKNLEEQALVLGGKLIYERLIKGYTEKQWGRPAKDIPAFIIRRLPFRLTYDNNYFDHPYQGIPIGGYNRLITKLLTDTEVRLNTDFFGNREYFEQLAERIVFTGALDEFFDYRCGRLQYRSLRFETEELDIANFQGVAGVNYTDATVPFTRIIEHKHFEFGTQPTTVITREYSVDYSSTNDPYYPINDEANQGRLGQYQRLAASRPNVLFGGRLAEYKYYDMHQVIAAALASSEAI